MSKSQYTCLGHESSLPSLSLSLHSFSFKFLDTKFNSSVPIFEFPYFHKSRPINKERTHTTHILNILTYLWLMLDVPYIPTELLICFHLMTLPFSRPYLNRHLSHAYVNWHHVYANAISHFFSCPFLYMFVWSCTQNIMVVDLFLSELPYFLPFVYWIIHDIECIYLSYILPKKNFTVSYCWFLKKELTISMTNIQIRTWICISFLCVLPDSSYQFMILNLPLIIVINPCALSI